MDEIVPLRRRFRNNQLLSLLSSQCSSVAIEDMGVELVEERSNDGFTFEKYRLYIRDREGEMHRDRFIIERTLKSGRVREVRLYGTIYF